MCLTEGACRLRPRSRRTRAEPQADGSYRLHGNKIFISGGDHDLTDNIVHLVLARLPGAPAGTRGLSLFLAPKILPDGTRNAVRCDGIEKKMGIKGSATCVMSFDGATGWMVGEPNRGLAAMFAMMNAARLHVALQGLAHAEIAHQNALRYAHERLQSRAVGARRGLRPRRPDRAAPGDAPHACCASACWSKAARVVAYEAAHLLDLAAQLARCRRARARARPCRRC